MPKRQRIIKYPSEDIQGEGSWVRIAGLTVKEMRDAMHAGESDDFDAFELGIELITTHVVEWNWVDDDGEALPQPTDNPEVVDDLIEIEVNFLAERIQGNEEELKN